MLLARKDLSEVLFVVTRICWTKEIGQVLVRGDVHVGTGRMVGRGKGRGDDTLWILVYN